MGCNDDLPLVRPVLSLGVVSLHKGNWGGLGGENPSGGGDLGASLSGHCGRVHKQGQLPILMVGIIFLVIVVKMPEKDVSKLAFEIVQDLKTLHLLGYALFIVTLGFWYLHAQLMRRLLHGKSPKANSGGKP